jgi:NDP-sugar pyrophosphorylase family protein
LSARKVLILAAGCGTRLEPYTTKLNKIILPVKDGITVLDHIIKNFAPTSEFVLAVGYKSEDVKRYVRENYPDRRIEFANVEPFAGPKSSPGFSAYCAREYIHEPFYLVYADTLWSEDLNGPATNWLGVATLSYEDSIHYCNVEIARDAVIAIKYKKAVKPTDHKTYVGLAHIFDWSLFFANLKISNESFSIENALEFLMREKGLGVYNLSTWRDIGRRELYEKIISNSQRDALRDRP